MKMTLDERAWLHALKAVPKEWTTQKAIERGLAHNGWLAGYRAAQRGARRTARRGKKP